LLNDELKILPDRRIVGQMICADPISLGWSDEEFQMLREDDDLQVWTKKLPPGLHFRPSSSGDYLIILWQVVHEHIHGDRKNPDVELQKFFNDMYPELVVRGLAQYVPSFEKYIGKLTRSNASIDGGYYTHAEDNRPILGPVPNVDGAFVCGGFSGYGIMAAPAAGEMIANYIAEPSSVPEFASKLAVDRKMEAVSDDSKAGGQL
jgi:glycine/D-amino acid oxidase-like deaminating enzyme